MRVDLRVLRAALAFVVAPAGAQTAADGPILAARRVIPTVAIKAWNPAGLFRVVAWDKDSVVVRGRVARTERFMFGGDSTVLKLGVDGTTGNEARSDFVVYVPRRSNISLKTVSADIIGEGVTGWYYSVSGSIRLSGQATSIEAESMNGSMDLNVSAPWVRARTGQGNLLVRGEPQDIDASTISGTLSIATESLLRGRFASVSGDIHYAGTPAPASIVEFSNHSGAVELLMPPSASALLALSSVTGAIENGFTRIRPTSTPPRALRVTLGRGEAQVTVRTFKGPIRLRPQ